MPPISYVCIYYVVCSPGWHGWRRCCGLNILTTFQETFQMDQHWITFELPTFNQGWQVNIDKGFISVDVKLINLSTHIQRWFNVESPLCACWVPIYFPIVLFWLFDKSMRDDLPDFTSLGLLVKNHRKMTSLELRIHAQWNVTLLEITVQV